MRKILLLCSILSVNVAVAADPIELNVTMSSVNEIGDVASIGYVSIKESEYGLLLTPNLTGLPAGVHGFHIHQNPTCAPLTKDGKSVAALAAGGHWDPNDTKKHGGPYGDGHLGDLPSLFVSGDGTSATQLLAPRIKSVSQIKGRALMVHIGGDNHSDHPMPLGGGGARIACGLIE
ncbi:superoxide dismutase family protein [Undibacterium crateris]|uniref:superoxide dismutase family protein n=1 Tax=Undibacterium crateris TaxID=2528175 RepID=UPI001389FF5A|nr:superoxide dismutase family protein [Undibacterium crateris]NDI87603.1 superoxide dismutase [Cu-Zn] SodC2 [Undibacterium crateris]